MFPHFHDWSLLQVFDYDWGLQDDFMGSAKIDLTQLELGKAEDINLPLNDVNHPERQMGEILINLTLWPRSQEDKEMVSVSLSNTVIYVYVLSLPDYTTLIFRHRVSWQLNELNSSNSWRKLSFCLCFKCRISLWTF